MKNVHIISHSHWDREWYMPFEYHRSYLIKLVDKCIELFENDGDFKSFHMDGHTALIEDYLEIKPDNEEKIKVWFVDYFDIDVFKYSFTYINGEKLFSHDHTFKTISVTNKTQLRAPPFA